MNAAVDLAPRASLRDLSVACYTSGWTQFHYKANRLVDVTYPGFFADATTFMQRGDHISVSAPDGGALLCVGQDGEVHTMCRVRL